MSRYPTFTHAHLTLLALHWYETGHRHVQRSWPLVAAGRRNTPRRAGAP